MAAFSSSSSDELASSAGFLTAGAYPLRRRVRDCSLLTHGNTHSATARASSSACLTFLSSFRRASPALSLSLLYQFTSEFSGDDGRQRVQIKRSILTHSAIVLWAQVQSVLGSFRGLCRRPSQNIVSRCSDSTTDCPLTTSLHLKSPCPPLVCVASVLRQPFASNVSDSSWLTPPVPTISQLLRHHTTHRSHLVWVLRVSRPLSAQFSGASDRNKVKHSTNTTNVYRVTAATLPSPPCDALL